MDNAMNERPSYKVSSLAGGCYLSYPNALKAIAGFNELSGVEAKQSTVHDGLKIYIDDKEAGLKVEEYAEKAGLRLCNMGGDIITTEPVPEEEVEIDLSEFFDDEDKPPEPDGLNM